MSLDPLVTVVIAAYKSEKFIRWTLQSIQRQTLSNFEVRIVGDGCDDGTEQVVASLNDSRFHWKNLEHSSRSNATNQGIRDAKGKYIAYLDHDDLWFPWHLSDLVACLEENKADFVFSWYFAAGSLQDQYEARPPFLHENPRGSHGSPSCWLHSKEIIDTCGPWRCDIHNLRHFPDTEFFLRVQQHNKKIQFCRSLNVIYFPSAFWLFQQCKDSFPQQNYFERMCEDASKLQSECLLDIAFQYAGRLPLPKRWPRWLIKLSHWYGQDRFPIYQMLRWRFLRRRKKWLSYH